MSLLGLQAQPPSVAALHTLVHQHVLSIRFENVSALLRRRDCPIGPVPPPDLDRLMLSWEEQSGGGVCFEICAMLLQLLTNLGYDAHRVLGKISLPNGHQAIIVNLAGNRYLLDLGNGAPIFEPIQLDQGPVEVHRHGLSFRFRGGPGDSELFQDRLIDGAWSQHCEYNLAPAAAADMDKGYQHHHTPNASWVTGTLTLVRSTESCAYSLRDAVLTKHTSAAKQARTLVSHEDYIEAVGEAFEMPALPIIEALAVRREFSQLDGGSSRTR